MATLRASSLSFMMNMTLNDKQWPVALLMLALAGGARAADSPELIAKGEQLFQAKICFTCHETPGKQAPAGLAMKAPKFKGGFWGQEREVTIGFGGPTKKVKFDEAYFIESVRKPIAKVLKSAAAPMPPPPMVNDEEMKALIAYVKSLSDGTAPAGIVAKGAIQDFKYRVYNGAWSKLPNFEKLKPVKTGETKSGIADTTLSEKRDNFGLVIEGKVEIKKKGKYTFKLGSDDGSRLYVDDKPIINNDGVHGIVVRTGAVNLDPGMVPIRIEFFERSGGEHLSLDMSGPGIKKIQLARSTAPQGGGNKQAFPTGNPIAPENNEAVMYRNFIQGASPRGIGVGYPEKLNLCFDANALNIVMTWHGAFMDGAKHWNGRGQGFQPPSGHYLVHLKRVQAIAQLEDAKATWPVLNLDNNANDRAKGLRFRGYRLVEGRRPIFKYTAGETVIEDYVIPVGGPLPSFTRQLTLTGSGQYYFLAGTGDAIEKDGTSWKLGQSLKVTLDTPGEPILRDGPGGKELLVPIDVKGKALLRAKYEWDLN